MHDCLNQPHPARRGQPRGLRGHRAGLPEGRAGEPDHPLRRRRRGARLPVPARRVRRSADGARARASSCSTSTCPAPTAARCWPRSRPTDDLKQIPVIVLTTSTRRAGHRGLLPAGANSYIKKPVDLEGFMQAIQRLNEYWFEVVILPKAGVSRAMSDAPLPDPHRRRQPRGPGVLPPPHRPGPGAELPVLGDRVRRRGVAVGAAGCAGRARRDVLAGHIDHAGRTVLVQMRQRPRLCRHATRLLRQVHA